MTQRPAQFQIDPGHPLLYGNALMWLGRAPGLSIASDNSGLGNHGTLTAMDPATDHVFDNQIGRWCLDFVRASSQCVVFPNLAQAGEMTISAWFKPASDYTNAQVILASADASTAYTSFALTFGFTDQKFELWNREFGPNSTMATAVASDVLHHVVAIRTGSTGNWTHRLFLDGNLDKTQTGIANGPTSVGSQVTAISRFGAFNGYYANARMADVCLWSHAIPAAWIPCLADPSNTLLEVGGRPLILPPRRRFLPAAVAGADTYTLTAASSSFTLTGESAGISVAHKVAAGLGEVTLTGQAATVAARYSFAARAGVFTATGKAASVSERAAVTAGQGTMTLTGQAATIKGTLPLSAGAASFTLSGQAAEVAGRRAIVAGLGSFTLTGEASAIEEASLMAAGAASCVLTGQSADMKAAYVIPADLGQWTLSGQAASITSASAYSVTAAVGSVTHSGQAAAISVLRHMVVGAGSLDVSGQAVGFKLNYKLAAGMGAWTLSGQVALLRGGERLSAACGFFDLAGQDAALPVRRTLAEDAGRFSVSGQPATMRVGRKLTAAAGLFTLAGREARVQKSGLQWDVQRCSVFSGGPIKGQIVTAGQSVGQVN